MPRPLLLAGLGAVAGLTAVTALGTPTALAVPATSTSTTALSSAPAPDSELALPTPTGTLPIGRAVLDLVDPDRVDPWVPTEHRELMVSVWYPSRPSAHRKPAAYMTAAESQLTLAGLPLPPTALTTVVTHARENARPLGGRHRLPLVLLSPGLGDSRATLTGLAEELASRGYVVAAIDHTYEAAGISFPDGRVAVCKICGDVPPAGRKVTAGRARDVSFVLDRLLARHSAWTGGTVIDPKRVAMAGHSIGGASALAAMLIDHRVDVGVNLDGSFFPALCRPLRRPFLMVSSEGHGPGKDPSWTKTWKQLRGGRLWIGVTGTMHNSFNDFAVLSDQVGEPSQAISGTRASQITRTYVTAFLDHYLRHRPEPLLNAPAAEYPEVRFFTP